MTRRMTRVALAVSWVLTAASILWALHLWNENSEQAEHIKRLKCAANLRGLGDSFRIYSQGSFDLPQKPGSGPGAQP